MEKSTSSAVPIDDDKRPSASGEEEVVMVEEKDCCFRPIHPISHGSIMLTILAIVGLSVFLVKRNSSSLSPDNSAPPFPTLEFKKLIATDPDINPYKIGRTCSISDEVVLVGTPNGRNGVAAYVFDLNGTEVNKLIPANEDEEIVSKWPFSIHEKIVLGTRSPNHTLQVFSSDVMYERAIKCEDDCSSFGGNVATFGDIAVTDALYRGNRTTSDSEKLVVYNITDGELLKVIEADADTSFFADIAVSDKAIVAIAFLDNDAEKVVVYSISKSFEKITEIGGENYYDSVATVGDKMVVGDVQDSAYLYDLNGTLLQEFKGNTSGASGFGSSVDMTDEKIIIGAPYEDEGRGVVYVYSTLTGELENKIQSPESEDLKRFGYCVGASNNHYVIGAASFEKRNGTAYLFEV